MTMMGTQDDRTRTFALDVLGDKVIGAQTSAEVLHAAGLDGWELRKVPLTATVREMESDGDTFHDHTITVPGKFAVVGKTSGVETVPYRPLGVVGSRYQIVQNEQTFALLDDLLDAAGERLPFEYAGSMYDGRKVFVGMLLPNTISVGGHDDVQMRLLAVNTHDGTSPFSLSLHINRVACTNAIELTKSNARRGVRQHWQLRHTSSIEGRVQQARESLALTFKAVDAFEAEAEALYRKSITDRQFERLIENVFPIPTQASTRQRDSIGSARSRVRDVYRESSTQSDIHGTAWGALNAFVEWADWVRDVRPGKRDETQVRALTQLDSHHVAKFKANVMDRALALK